MYCNHRLYKRNGRNIRDVTNWFVDYCSEANSFESGQRHLENFRCMLGKKEHGFYLYGHEAEPWAEWGGCYGYEGWISRTLVNQPVNHDVAMPQCIPCFIVKYKIQKFHK